MGEKATAKKAPSKLPKKQWWKIILNVIAILMWVWISIFFSQLVLFYLIMLITGTNPSDQISASSIMGQPAVSAIYSALSYILAMVLIIFVPPKVSARWQIINETGGKSINGAAAPKALNRQELGLKGWPTWTDIGLSVAGFVVYLVIAAALVAAFTWLNERGIAPWFDANETQDVGFSTYAAGIDRVIAFVTLVVVAPIAEEIIFRGWLYKKLRNKFSEKTTNEVSIVFSVLLTSLLFGLVHGQWNVGVNVFAMSIVACLLREFTGTIYASILLHMIKNGVAFYLLFVMGMG